MTIPKKTIKGVSYSAVALCAVFLLITMVNAGKGTAKAQTTTSTITATAPAATSTIDIDVMGLSGSDQAELTIADITTGTTTTVTIGDEISPFTMGANDSYAITATTTALGYSVSTSSNCSGPFATDTVCSVIFIPPNAIPTSTNVGITILNTVDNAAPLPGGIVNYTIMVSALGPSTSSAAIVTDLLPSGLTLLNASASTGIYNTTTGVWTIGDLTAGSTATLKIAATVDAGDVVGTTIANIATVAESSTETNPDQAQTLSTASVTVGATMVIPPTPPFIVLEVLSIGQDGSFLGRGMTVTSVGSSSFQASIWGITYTVDLMMPPQFFFRGSSQDSSYSPGETLEQLSVGDVVGVSGAVTTPNPLVVNGQVIRNYTIISPRPWPVDSNRESPTSTFGSDQSNNENSSSGLSSTFQGELNSLAVELQNLENMFNSQNGGGR